ncbi:MAG: hypothetical protein HXY46_03005 [Syntrophaceae bacterium]|nr:hypothetical protein [Syntrophaceae bacterium]
MKNHVRFSLFVFISVVFIPILSEAEGIRWEAYQSGMAKAKVERRKIFINFHADW